MNETRARELLRDCFTTQWDNQGLDNHKTYSQNSGTYRIWWNPDANPAITKNNNRIPFLHGRIPREVVEAVYWWVGYVGGIKAYVHS
jgi:hypothetical protein